MNDDTAPDDAAQAFDIRVSHRFNAPPPRVFAAWLDTDALSRWLFGPAVRDERILGMALDARVGGAFAFRVERDGAAIEHLGRYLAIDPPHRLAFTWRARRLGDADDDDSRVEIDIAPHDGGCALTLTHRMHPRWADRADDIRRGWARAMALLDAAIAHDDDNGVSDGDGRDHHPDGDRGGDAYATRVADGAIGFERIVPGPIERIWAFLTESDQRARWLAAGPMALEPGGAMALHFRNADLARLEGVADDPAPEHYRDYENDGHMFGRIALCEPPHRLRFTWTETPGDGDEDDSLVEIVLTPASDGGDVRIVLVHRGLRAYEMPSVAAGWHTHLGILEDHCHARPPRPFWRTHTALEADYDERPDIIG